MRQSASERERGARSHLNDLLGRERKKKEEEEEAEIFLPGDKRARARTRGRFVASGTWGLIATGIVVSPSPALPLLHK